MVNFFLWRYEIFFCDARFTFVIVLQVLRTVLMNYDGTQSVLWRVFCFCHGCVVSEGWRRRPMTNLSLFVKYVVCSMTKLKTSSGITSWMLLFLLVVASYFFCLILVYSHSSVDTIHWNTPVWKLQWYPCACGLYSWGYKVPTCSKARAHDLLSLFPSLFSMSASSKW